MKRLVLILLSIVVIGSAIALLAWVIQHEDGIGDGRVPRPEAWSQRSDRNGEPAEIRQVERGGLETGGADAARTAPLPRSSGGLVHGYVRELGGTPISGARVRALGFGHGSIELPEMATTLTDSQGRYELRNVSWRCVVEASSQSHFTQRKMAIPTTRLDFGLGQPGSLRGRVTYSAHGLGCEGATVALYLASPEDELPVDPLYYSCRVPPVVSTRTRDGGEFHILRLRPGKYHLRVMSVEGSQCFKKGRPVEVPAGEEVVQDLVIGAGYCIVGRVLSHTDREPIVRANVFFMSNPRKRAITDSEGRFELSGIGDRSNPVLVATAPGYVQREISGVRPPHAIGETVVRNLVLRRAGRIRGRVLGPGGEPVVGARVSARPGVLEVESERMKRVMPGEFSFPPGEFGVSGGDGAFSINARARPGGVRVFAVTQELAWGVTDPIPFQNGEEVSGVEIRLRDGGGIKGCVRDGRGVKIAGARVLVCEHRQGGAFGGRELVSRKATCSDADGRYRVQGLPEGLYAIVASPQGVADGAESPLSSTVIEKVAVRESTVAHVDIVLNLGSSIGGRIVNCEGVAIPGAVVKALPAGGGMARPGSRPPHERNSKSDGNGYFRLVGLWQRGHPYQLLIGARGHDANLIERVQAGDQGLVIKLNKLRTLRGRVVRSQTGEPVSEFRVVGNRIADRGELSGRRRLSFNDRISRVFAESEGSFAVEVLPGKYTVEAYGMNGERSDSQVVTIPEIGESSPVELRVQQGARIHGTVHDERGEVCPLAGIRLWSVNTEPLRRLRKSSTDSEGRFDLVGLPKGECVMIVRSTRGGRYLESSRRFSVGGVDTIEVKLVLRSGSNVSIMVIGEDQAPLAGARVAVSRSDGIPGALQLSSSRLRHEALFNSANVVGSPQERLRAFEAARIRSVALLTSTGEDGKLGNLTLGVGDYEVRVTAPGYVGCRQVLQVDASPKQSIRIRLRATGKSD